MKSLKVTSILLMCVATLVITSCDNGGGSIVAEHWTRLSGVSYLDTFGQGISTDSSGNVYVAGYTYGFMDGQILSGNPDTFLIKYNDTGVKQWTRLSGGSNVWTYGYGTSTDESGVYVAGFTTGNLDGEALTGEGDAFVIKYNSSGVKYWTSLSGVSLEWTVGKCITTDSGGNVFVAGYTEGDLDGEDLSGARGAFVIKYNTNGAKHWTRLSGIYTSGEGISTDSSGNVYVTGYTEGDLDGEDLSGARDAFVIKYNTSGDKQWTRLAGVSGVHTYGNGIKTDSSGNVYVTGYTEGALDGEILTGTQDAFVIKYNSSGDKQWTMLSGVSGVSTYGKGISTDSSGNVYVAGYTEGALDDETLTGTLDAFVIKYNASGVKQWTMLSGVSGVHTYGTGISTDSSGKVYVAGYTGGALDGETLTGTQDAFITTGFNN